MNDIIRRKNTIRQNQFNQLEKEFETCNVLKGITEKSSPDLVKNLKNGELSAVDVLRAFQSKALKATKFTNCVTEFIPQALVRY